MTEAVEVAQQDQSIRDLFIDKARAAAATVVEVSNFDQAVDYALDLCANRGACRLKVSGCEEHLSDTAEALCETKIGKIIAAPGFAQAMYQRIEQRFNEAGFDCIESGMRSQLAGVDIGFTRADFGIAETGTLVLNCPSEELRLATMVCEYHVCILESSKIFSDAQALEKQLNEFMGNGPDYTAFITGPSRTADIERVLTIGVHGPLELHILLLED
jgi:L-lactate dehydrogenase complex protein LldG